MLAALGRELPFISMTIGIICSSNLLEIIPPTIMLDGTILNLYIDG